jgi:transposase
MGRLDGLRTPEGGAIPPLAMAELRGEDQIKELEQQRMARLNEDKPRKERANGMVRLLTRVPGVGLETADMLTHEFFCANCGIGAQLLATPD